MAKQIEKSGIQDILVVGDRVYGEEKRKVFQNTDFFIMTSRYEGMPMSMIEAMSYGIPCFASIGTNLSNEIHEFEAGWVCDNTSESIAKALLKLCKDKNNMELYGKNARELSFMFGWDVIASRTHSHYKSLLGR